MIPTTGPGAGARHDFVLESCHSVWLFEPAQERFRRFMKGIQGEQYPKTDWRRYYGVEVDGVSESFVVLLDPEGSRMLRSWIHPPGCTRCGEEGTAELNLEDLRLAALA